MTLGGSALAWALGPGRRLRDAARPGARRRAAAVGRWWRRTTPRRRCASVPRASRWPRCAPTSPWWPGCWRRRDHRPLVAERRRGGPDSAADVLAVVRRAFGARPALDPPSTALDETSESVRAVLADDGRTAGAARRTAGRRGAVRHLAPGRLGMRRVSVDPAHQGHGVASVMVGIAEDVAEGARPGRHLAAGPRGAARQHHVLAAPGLRRDRARRAAHRAGEDAVAGPGAAHGGGHPGLRVPAGHPARPPATWWCSPAGSARARRRWRRASGAGLGVRGDVTSPTFVISRVHPASDRRPDLVHVDAYRLGGAAELDDLDLDRRCRRR